MGKKKITNNNQTYANMNQKTNSNLCMNLKSDAKVGIPTFVCRITLEMANFEII